MQHECRAFCIRVYTDTSALHEYLCRSATNFLKVLKKLRESLCKSRSSCISVYRQCLNMYLSIFSWFINDLLLPSLFGKIVLKLFPNSQILPRVIVPVFIDFTGLGTKIFFRFVRKIFASV